MGNASNLPLALWQANLQLQQRIGRLLQDSGRAWMQLGTRAAGEGAAEFDAEFRRLLHGGDWQALAALPVEAFWRQAEQRVGDGQAFNQLALQVQDGFVRGLGEALQDWQAQLAEAWSDAGLVAGAVPDFAQAWDALVANWDTGLATMARAAAATTPPAARKQAPPSEPASAGKAPAKQATARKAPVKQAAARKAPAKKPPSTKKGSRTRGG